MARADACHVIHGRSTWLVIREGLEDLPPFTSAAARFLAASPVTWIVAGPIALVLAGVGLVFRGGHGAHGQDLERAPSS